jgi:AraC-like DNA-binding protein
MVLPAASPVASVLRAHMEVLSAAGPSLSAREGVALAAGSVRLIAACLGANPRASDEIEPSRAAAVKQLVRDFIDQHLTSPLMEPDLLVRHFRISRARLYRLFAEDGGVAAYIQSRRLRHCYLAITDPNQAGRYTGDIAFDHGFTSDAHFSRAVRRAFGVTPGEARAQTGPVRPPSREAFINEWMIGLAAGSTVANT